MMIGKWILSAALLGAAAGTFAAPPQAPAPMVSVEKAVEISESAGKKYVGHLEAIEEVEIRARVSGYINLVKFKEGEQVKAGQLLFELEDTTYRAKVQAAKAQVDQIKAELDYAQKNYNRQKTLREGQAVSESTMDDASRLLTSTKAKLDEAEASLLDAENNLSYTKIYSPINGTIGKMTYTQGNYVTPSSEKLADVVQTTPIYANFAISERDYLSMFGSADAMRANANIRLILADGSEYKHPGKVAFVDNKVDAGTNTLTIWATFENAENQLIPGGFVTVVLSKKVDRSYPAIRLSALMTDNNGNYIYVLDDKNNVIRREVKTGPMVGSWQVILSGVAPGETVVVDGTHKAMPGQAVNPVPVEQ